ncbi:DUF2971 domain-containing protein [Photobacterium angustum]|nr:DUF2971 domain-containing protein [Photobacterium angustum]
MLDTSSLFLTRVSCFEDELEGGLTPSYIMVTNGMVNLLSQILYTMPLANTPTPEEVEERNTQIKKLKDEYENHTYNTVFGSFKHDEVEYETVFQQHRHWVDVSCWHANKSESMAMWKIYGGSTNSVCVVTDVAHMEKAVKSSSEYNLVLSRVYYISHDDEPFKEYHGLAPLMHKSDFYAFENEVRLMAYKPSAKLLSTRPEDDRGTTVKINLNTLIREVRVAYDAPEWFFHLVDSITKKYGVNAPVVRSKMRKLPIFQL